MSTRARGRPLTIAVAGVAAMTCALTAPTAAAHASAGGYTPNPHQWYFSKWGVQQDIWPTTEGAGVTVAVIDSGVQANIPDLQGVVKPGGDTAGSTGAGEKDYAPNGGHGTAVASLIAGQGVDGGPVGIAPQAKILPVHAAYPTLNVGTSVPDGIKYAVNHGAQVINISLGQISGSAISCDPAMQQAVSYALSHNVVVVAASGDTNVDGSNPLQPASCAGVLAVGAVEPSGSLWPNSIQGLDVSVAAPGDQMYTVSDNGQEYSYTSSGTSFSAPLVSGAAALIRAANPSMPWYTIDQRLTATAVPVGHVPNSGVGFGIINIDKALNPSQYPVSSSAPNPTYARYQKWLKATGQSSASSSGGSASQASSSSSGGGTSVWLIIGIVIVVLIIAAVVIIILATRGRSRRGPRDLGGGYPPDTYAAPGQQYPQGQYPQPGQYPPQYPPPGQQPHQGQRPPPGQYPQGQQPPPGQYPPPGGQQYPPGPYQPGQQYPPQPGQYPPPQR